jgi:hypothetical protein
MLSAILRNYSSFKNAVFPNAVVILMFKKNPESNSDKWLSVKCHSAKCHSSECRHAKCHSNGLKERVIETAKLTIQYDKIKCCQNNKLMK